MKKKFYIFILLLFIIFFTGIQNISAKESIPSDWKIDLWDNNAGVTKIYSETEESHSGKSYFTIESVSENDAKLIKVETVKPNSYYKLSAWIKTTGIGETNKGANISVISLLDTSIDIKGSTDNWNYIELYGKTGDTQKELQVALRLGGYGSLNYGKASFDDFSIEEIKGVPEGIRWIYFASEKENGKAIIEKANSENNTVLKISFVFLICLFSIAYWLMKKKLNLKPKQEKVLLITILALGVILRIVWGLTSKGYPSDMACFKGWADISSKDGLANIYLSNIFIDYLPGYIYILFFIGKIQKLFDIGFDSSTMLLLLKSPAIIADLISSIIIFKLAKKKLEGIAPLVLTSIYLLNPAIFINSAIWGQIDGFFTLFILIVIVYLTEKKLLEATLIFVVAALIKPQAFIFTPVLIYAFLEKKDIKLFLKTAGYSFGLFVLLILPFSLKQQPLWIVNKYIDTLSSYAYATINAYNFYALIGANWALDSTKFLFLPYKVWGFIALISIVSFSAFIYIKAKVNYKLQYIAFFIITATFVISTKMHERYIFPALILAIIWYIYSKDKRVILTFFVLSLTAYINQAFVLYDVQTDIIVKLVSLVNVILLIRVVKIGISYCKEADIVKAKEPIIVSEKSKKGEKTIFVRKDYGLILILVAIYTIIAFINLGSTKVPESFWKATEIGESFYVDFGKVQNVDKLSYYAGSEEGEYEVSYSSDLENWSNVADINKVDIYSSTNDIINKTNIYNWQSISINKDARYIKLTVNKPNGRLLEMGFFTTENKTPLKIKEVTKININNNDEGELEKIFDEQNTVEENPSYLTGMIFDEIYHARTAYEQINKIEMFEWTHPPLGKLIIALGIEIFGMNPFGWRVMGTIFGIAMIPFMYFLGKRLFKKTEYAFIAALLMTFDFMHFTQTRIATVDGYAVFFIILMYYFMVKFIEIDVYKEGLKKTFLPLVLCGISFSLGVATKWICIYSAVGLAILFFKEIYERYLVCKVEKEQKGKKGKKQKGRDIWKQFKADQISTLGLCIFLFILLPITVYTISYIPFMMIPGPGHGLKEVINFQKLMYDYHSKLKETHFFESPWWQWPLMVKPMWYYTGQSFLTGDKISTISAMGNPMIWWAGIITFISTIYIGIKKKDKVAFIIIVGGLSQYLPWVLVPRLTFIYHYFATLPFVMLSIVYVIAYLREEKNISKYYIFIYLFMVILMFVLFYPVISGMMFSKSYVMNFLKWFNTWYF